MQDESFDGDGVLHLTDLYNRKAVMMVMPHRMQSAEECEKYIKESIKRTLLKIMDDVDITLKVKPANDIQHFYEKNMIGGMWESGVK